MKHVFYVENYEKVIDENHLKDYIYKIENKIAKDEDEKEILFGHGMWRNRWYEESDGLWASLDFKNNPEEYIKENMLNIFIEKSVASTVESNTMRLAFIGDKVKLLFTEGSVTDVYYDPSNNTVHYKTDIKIYRQEEVTEQEMKSIIQSYYEQADELEKFCKDRITERNLRIQADKEAYEKRIKKRPFWKKLLK